MSEIPKHRCPFVRTVKGTPICQYETVRGRGKQCPLLGLDGWDGECYHLSDGELQVVLAK